MKRTISLLLVVTFIFALCACSSKPDTQEMIVEANRFIASQRYSADYSARGEYSADYNCYFVQISVNEKVLDGTGWSKNSLEAGALFAMMCNSEVVDEMMDYIFNNLKGIFEESSIDVVVGFYNHRGEITKTRTTMVD